MNATEVVRGTRWGRTLVALLISLSITAAYGVAAARGAFALSVHAQSGDLAVVASKGSATGVGAVLIPLSIKNDDGSDGKRWVLKAGIAKLAISGACLAQQQTFLGKTFTMVINVPERPDGSDAIEVAGVDATVSNVVAGVDVFGGIRFNKNGADVRVPGYDMDLGGTRNDFGVELDSATVFNVVGSAQMATIHGIASLPGVHFDFVNGAYTCPTGQ